MDEKQESNKCCGYLLEVIYYGYHINVLSGGFIKMPKPTLEKYTIYKCNQCEQFYIKLHETMPLEVLK